MVAPSKLRTAYANADWWLREHTLAWWLLLAVVPGGTYAGANVLLGDGALHSAVVLGAVFGATFATLTISIQRRRQP